MKKRKGMKPVDVNKLARKIAASLFVNGLKQKGVRLVLVDSNERYFGGWCEQAVADQIERYLVEGIVIDWIRGR